VDVDKLIFNKKFNNDAYKQIKSLENINYTFNFYGYPDDWLFYNEQAATDLKP